MSEPYVIESARIVFARMDSQDEDPDQIEGCRVELLDNGWLRWRWLAEGEDQGWRYVSPSRIEVVVTLPVGRDEG